MKPALRHEIERSVLLIESDRLGVAVSGGGDSLALLHVLSSFSHEQGIELSAVTVDHKLREDSTKEALFVGSVCARLNVPHDILYWEGWDGHGNTQNEARMARYGLISDWARSKGIKSVTLGHTKDDQAETFLMRLARGSGVDGLSAMAPRRDQGGITWVRPMLRLGRDDLRQYLQELGETWIEDPSNEDDRFERIKARETLKLIDSLGIDADVLAQVARNMSHAREALAAQTLDAARSLVSFHAGAVCLEWHDLCELPFEIRRRLFVAALGWLSGAAYPPRRDAFKAAWDAVVDSGAATLTGCLWRRKKSALWLCREFNAIGDTDARPNALWDGRWTVIGPDVDGGCLVRAIGENGLAMCPGWRETGLPRDVLICTPAVWRGDELVAAPVINPHPAWRAVLQRGEAEFFDAVISH